MVNRKPKAERQRQTGSNRVRAGFSMAEILVSLTIAGVLAALLLVNLAHVQSDSQRARLVEALTVFVVGLREFDRDVGVFPETLDMLYRRPTTSDKDICKVNLSQAQVDKWGGPYILQEIPSAGLIYETDTIDVILKRKPTTPTAGESADLQMFVANVPQDEAEELDDRLDGDGLLTKGRIQWNTSSGYPRLIFTIQIADC
jgi:prepilin-type N-terminal cleavage/methylation domain-containing protein